MITVGIDSLNEVKADPDDHFFKEKDLDAIKLVIDSLPSGYKIIFNLYVVEGFKHKEIAQELLGGNRRFKVRFAKCIPIRRSEF